MVICLERGANLHMAQLMPLPLTVSFFSKIQIGFTFLVLAHPGSPGQRAIKRMYVMYVCMYVINGFGSILLWWHSKMLHTCGFMDDVIFSHNGRE